MTKVKDLTGKRFGRLVVVELIGKATNGKYQWKCRCDCGNYTVVKGNSLTTGHTKSCGCIERDSKRPNPIGEEVIRKTYEKYKDIIEGK